MPNTISLEQAPKAPIVMREAGRVLHQFRYITGVRWVACKSRGKMR